MISWPFAIQFALSLAFQIAGMAILPQTAAFTRPAPSALAALFLAISVYLMSRLIANGGPISVLLPLAAALAPLVIVLVGVFVLGEPASPTRLALLVAACVLVGIASRV